MHSLLKSGLLKKLLLNKISKIISLNTMKLILGKYVLALFFILNLLSACYAQLPKVQTQGDITYISGGIGEDEARAMKSDSKSWPLSIEFSEHLVSQDLWVAQVYLRILDSTGKTLFDTTVDGPIFLGKVPPGRYELLATYQGVTKRRAIVIKLDQHTNESFNWQSKK